MKGVDGYFWRDLLKLTKLLTGEQCWRNIVDNTKEATAATGCVPVHVGTRLLGFISKLL
jgi:hypothetical protein